MFRKSPTTPPMPRNHRLGLVHAILSLQTSFHIDLSTGIRNPKSYSKRTITDLPRRRFHLFITINRPHSIFPIEQTPDLLFGQFEPNQRLESGIHIRFRRSCQFILPGVLDCRDGVIGIGWCRGSG